MSNVCFSIAASNLCRARTAQTLHLQQFLRPINSSIGIARRDLAHHACRAARPGYFRTIVNRGQQRSKSTLTKSRTGHESKPPLQAQPQHDNLPDSKLRDGVTQASHTEGVLSEESWRNYDPDGGLPLPDGELDSSSVEQIFGAGMHVENGNYILCVVNYRRMSGSLVDVGLRFPPASEVTDQQALEALQYLREAYPEVDEQKLGAQWAEEESSKLRKQLQDRAVRIGLYKASPEDEADLAEEEDDTKQGTAYGRARTGESMLERLRASNIANREAEENAARIRVAQKERSLLSAARGPLELAGGLQQQVGVKRYGTMDVVLLPPTSQAALVQSEPPAWVKYYEEQAQIIKDNIVPQMSTMRRLAPSLLVFALTLSGCYYLGTHYTPPPSEARLFPGMPPSVATVGTITAILLGAYIAGKVPQTWRTLNKYFTLVPAYPYAMSTLGAIIRHDTFGHLATNVAMLWIVGVTLHEDIGRGWFLATFIAAGVSGTTAGLVYHVLAKNWNTYIFGASGALYGLLGTICVLRPQGTVYLFGYEIPLAAWMILLLVGASNIRGVIRGARLKQFDSTDYVGHAGGLLAGITTGFVLRNRYKNDKTVAQQEIAKPVG